MIEETLAGRSDQIKGYTVAMAVYGRKADFDPQIDPIVRVEAGRLRRALEHYYLTDGIDDPIHISIPKGGYVPHFDVVAGNVTEIVAPFSASGEAVADTGPSLAVLPLENLTGDKGQDYFSDGLTEELTAELARYQDLRVIASQSALRFKNRRRDPKRIGSELGASFLLSGSLRKDSKTVKISIRLIYTATATQIWSDSYHRELTAENLIGLQEEIARTAVGAVADQYGWINRAMSKEARKKGPRRFPRLRCGFALLSL